jgi:glycosyltransferase involved in cell wall biosynthesis
MSLISVVIPTFNRAHRIGTAIRSVQSQTYADWELIVVDDGSTDGTRALVERMAADDARIRYLRLQHNSGAQHARNTGIKTACGEWVAFLDSDDEWIPESLEWRMAIAAAEHVAIVHSEAYVMRRDQARRPYNIPNWRGNVYTNALSREGPMFQALLVKKAALAHIGYLDENVVAFQEWDLSIELARTFAFGFEPRPTFIYDFDSVDAMSRSPVLAAEGYRYIVRKHFWSMLRHIGPNGLAAHYEIIRARYELGRDSRRSRRYQWVVVAWKLLNRASVLARRTTFVTRLFS